MNFNEILSVQEGAVNIAHARLQTEDGLVSGHAQINDSVVQTNVLLHYSKLATGLGFVVLLVRLAILSGLISHQTRSIVDLERKHGSGLVEAPKFKSSEFNLLRAASNGLFSFGHRRLDFNDTFLGQFA